MPDDDFALEYFYKYFFPVVVAEIIERPFFTLEIQFN